MVLGDDGNSIGSWTVELTPGGSQELHHSFAPQQEGGSIVRICVSDETGPLAVQDLAYIVGHGASLAVNFDAQETYDPQEDVSIPLVVENAGDSPTSTVLSLVTFAHSDGLSEVHRDTLSLNIDERSAVQATGQILAEGEPGLYTTRLLLDDKYYNSFDFLVTAEDTLYANVYPNHVSHTLGDTVEINLDVFNSVFTYTQASPQVVLWNPDGVTSTVSLTQLGTGQFQGSVDPLQEGTHIVVAEITNPGFRTVGDEAFFVVDRYSVLRPKIEGQLKLNQTSPLTVTVSNENRVPVSGAHVTISDTEQLRTGTTGLGGEVTLQATPTVSEPFQLVVEKTGYARTKLDLPVQVTTDTIPPPLLFLAPNTTNESPMTVTGITEGEAALEVNSQGVQVDARGRFTTSLPLNEGENVITGIATDEAGNSTTVTHTVELDTVPPMLSVAEPPEGLETTSDVISVTGTAEAGTTVVVSDTLVLEGASRVSVPSGQESLTADDSAVSFSAWVLLHSGINEIPIVATDAAGNTVEITRQVTLQQGPMQAVGGKTYPSSLAKHPKTRIALVVAACVVLAGGALAIGWHKD
jgi:hypothetical protein